MSIHSVVITVRERIRLHEQVNIRGTIAYWGWCATGVFYKSNGQQKQGKNSEQLTELLKEEMAASTSSFEENVTNPNPPDFEVPGTRETLVLTTSPFSEKNFLSVFVVTVLARFPT